MIIAKNNGGNFEMIPEGTHQAVCFAVHDIGLQSNNFGTTQHKVVISWEIKETIKAEGEYKGKRYVISNRYTLSLNEKSTLRKHLESWRGKKFTAEELDKGFDIEKVIGVNCMISVVHTESKNGKTYANVSAVMSLAKGMEKMTPENSTEPPDWVKELQGKAVQEESITASNDIPEPDSIDFDFSESNGPVTF